MDYLKQLCEDLNLATELEKSEAGFYLLPLTENLQVSVKELNPGVFLNSSVCPCPEIKREELFIKLMKANLFGQGTLGAALGLEPEQNLLTLSLELPYDMDYRHFKESVEDFTNIVDYWKVEVDTHVKLAKEGIV